MSRNPHNYNKYIHLKDKYEDGKWMLHGQEGRVKAGIQESRHKDQGNQESGTSSLKTSSQTSTLAAS